MNLAELQVAANKLCQEHWNVNYTGEIKLVNYAWKRKEASFQILFDSETLQPLSQTIVMSKKNNEKHTKETLLGYLLHELVHWRLYNTNLPFDDTDLEFVVECIKVRAPLSKTRSAQRAAVLYGFQGRKDLFKEHYGYDPCI